MLFRSLQEVGLHLHSVEEQIPEFRKNPESFRIKGDGHPNPEAYRLLAEYVCREILGEP